jgi:hypothetical protein
VDQTYGIDEHTLNATKYKEKIKINNKSDKQQMIKMINTKNAMMKNN